MIVVVPGSGPWVMLPDWNLLLCPLGADGSHFSPTRAFVVSFVCVMDWPGYFGTETSPRGRETEQGQTVWLASERLRCLHVPVGKMETRFGILVLTYL